MGAAAASTVSASCSARTNREDSKSSESVAADVEVAARALPASFCASASRIASRNDDEASADKTGPSRKTEGGEEKDDEDADDEDGGNNRDAEEACEDESTAGGETAAASKEDAEEDAEGGEECTNDDSEEE